ncbi:MAG TPA: carboxypeptidase regulatory-like domain-containing protein [Terriglobales bacterium]|nr:carboxypeptidase regulatory-like domain-containing protein [Terriglobales bacterium]
MRQAVCFLTIFSLFALTGAMAQTGVDGAILGVVTDPNGAVIAGATVTVTKLDTGVQRIETSRADGSFEISALPQGDYSVTVTYTGFKTWTLAKTELTINEHKRVEPSLQVGDVNERVTVESTADLLQTEKAETGGVVEQRTIQELPLNGRDVIELTELVPGVRYEGRSLSTACADGNTSMVQGLGHRDDQTEFRVDGVASNAVCDEGSTAIPNPDTIAQFNVSTSNFSAENGRNPVQVNMVTKSGTNEFHVTLWEFLRNNALDARNTFASKNPKLIQNQFGLAGGGPVIIPHAYNGKNKTFFFGSYEGTRIVQSKIYNSYTVSPQMLQGNFAGLPTITDPTTGQPFAGNQIPQPQISGASKFFFPWIPQANSPDQHFRAIASRPTNTDEFSGRVDHQLTQNQRIYWRILHLDTPQNLVGYLPSSTATEDTHSYSMALNYDYTITPTTLLNFSLGTVNTVNTSSPTCKAGSGPCTEIGKENLTADAGIQGFQTAGREQWIGLPDVISFAGYAGINSRNGWGDPAIFKQQSINGSVSLSKVWGKHTVVTGYQYDHLYLLAAHGSCCSKGVFDFNGQYTGNGFADYLLGYTDSSLRNYPIHTFGMKSNPYGAFFVDDSWKISSQFTVELGLRWDHWFAKTLIRGAGGTFDPKLGKAVAGTSNGKVDLTAQPVAPFLAVATQGQWVSASDAHVPAGLFIPNGYVSPRLGVAWRPLKSGDLVIRAGYGIFTSSYRGNITASQIISPPYWTYESQSWSPAQLQRWETAWPVNPNSFTASSVGAAAYDVKPMKDHEWNLSVQKTLPYKMAVTLSYVGSKADGLVVDNSINNVPPGLYTNLQAAKPYPIFGSIDLYKNTGSNHYNSGQLKIERRFSQGLSYMLSYAFSKNISQNGADGVWSTPTPFAPSGYNRGRASYDHTHILASNVVWEVPVGRGQRLGGSMNPVANAVIGGWEFSGIYLFSSGDPLSFAAPGGTLGNGWSTRANLVGDPSVSNPNASLWFNPSAFAKPGKYLFGNSGIGILDGPGSHVVNLALMKKFSLFSENRYLQLRWEAFNALNHVNLGDPNTSIGQGSTGRILSAGDARVMQIALKLVF